ncbi:4-oxalomesaconate tautomerase [Actinoplanes lutulentus]|uniref:4-oxalomesaconate tautomerase n=1 Tax=Actinoplanes lutulentus TaxID=1287878 RepID=A0A327ZKC1_9ACTN|nr:4-oxalomesaconate tautomerase [Actinoplanes lutulentus]MBB2943947.1 4-oxalomesaconate tautomerase [Actinoplanes lutulentus]RAK42820.1 4-oxalomesaconate tautomerase [Actinoplanes lutulentus]
MAGVPVLVMRGGTSKGAYFLASDLPKNPEIRDELLLRIMGSPDPRQIDGIGGGHPLTSKVAVVSVSDSPDADVDYLFLQVHVDRPLVSAEQPCGNILAGVGPFAVERGLVASVGGGITRVRVRMVNTGALATVEVPVSDGRPVYSGDTAISGVPGPAARLLVEFRDLAGSVTGALLPTGNRVDELDGIRATLIDNGMPVVLIEASSLGVTGYESPTRLEYDESLRDRVEKLRLLAGELMGLGDVRDQTVPKMCLVAPPIDGGSLCTRMFVPHRVHSGIGVLAGASVGAAAALPGSVAAGVVTPEFRGHGAAAGPAPHHTFRLEHPAGWFDVRAEMDTGRTSIVSTARLLLDGIVHPR